MRNTYSNSVLEYEHTFKCILCFFVTLTFCLSTSLLQGQELNGISALDQTLTECSGLHFTNDRILSILDSGNDEVIIEIDPESGSPDRIVQLLNVENIDWESITADEEYIYIGDFGNNDGTRQDLRILKLSLDDYLNESDMVSEIEEITFSYADQGSFSPEPFQTNFDAEALCAYGDNLVIFSKNWGNGYSKIYSIPKQAGNYEISPLDSINVQGLVTGCDCNYLEESATLIGHNTSLVPFAVRINEFMLEDLEQASTVQSTLDSPSGASTQVEGIAGSTSYFVASETFLNIPGWLFNLEWSGVLSNRLETADLVYPRIYPNPCLDVFRIDDSEYTSIYILAIDGKLVYSADRREWHKPDLDPGTYLVCVLKQSELMSQQKLIIER